MHPVQNLTCHVDKALRMKETLALTGLINELIHFLSQVDKIALSPFSGTNKKSYSIFRKQF